MRLAEQIAARRTKERRAFEIPEWGEDNKPLILYAKSITARDLNTLQRKYKNFLNDMNIEGMIELIIMKFETENGDKAFLKDDKMFLWGEDPALISSICGKLFSDTISVEEQEKN